MSYSKNMNRVMWRIRTPEEPLHGGENPYQQSCGARSPKGRKRQSSLTWNEMMAMHNSVRKSRVKAFLRRTKPE